MDEFDCGAFLLIPFPDLCSSCDVCEMWDCECGKADQSSKHDGDTSDGVPKPAESVVSLDDLKSQLSGDISTQEVTPDSSEQSESPQEQKDRQKDALAALLDDVLDDYIPPPKQPSPQPSPPQSPQKKATVASPGKPQLTIKPPPKLNFKKTQAQPASEPSEPSTPMTPSTPGTPSKRSTMQDFNIITVLGRGSYGKVVKARRSNVNALAPSITRSPLLRELPATMQYVFNGEPRRR